LAVFQHESYYNDVDFGPDGRLVAAARNDGKAEILELVPYQEGE
jgi:hypothetical protein